MSSGKAVWLHPAAQFGVQIALALALTACTSGTAPTGATATAVGSVPQPVDRSGVPTAAVTQIVGGQPASPSGLQIEDRCMVGRMDSGTNTGQVFGNGVNIVVEVDSVQSFSRVVGDTAQLVCGSNPSGSEGQQLVARLNASPGIHVVDYTWPNR